MIEFTTLTTSLASDSNNPETLVQQRCQQLLAGADGSSVESAVLAISYPYICYWRADQQVVELTAVYCLQKQPHGIDIQFVVADQNSGLLPWLRGVDLAEAALLPQIKQQFGLPVFSVSQPLALCSVSIPKPWGQEIWYTGIEERGVATVGSENLQQLLPWVLSALPQLLCAGKQESLILLKILDPLPETVVGDLYFELHQQKREVYVVTAVNKQAWPNGEGAIRFGFNPTKRNQFADADSFREAFAEAVKAYETIRREIDSLIDEMRLRDGVGLDTPVSAARQADWLAALPQSLQDQERHLRTAMESFTDTLALQVGDVVKVPCLTPHALQHGVRTVEFQTPVYERLILSFAQKVLTQQHWDTDEAVALMKVDGVEQEDLQLLSNEDGVKVERIVDFEDFEVRRVAVEAQASMFLSPAGSYGLLMVVSGELKLKAISVHPEQAILLPKAWVGEEITNSSDSAITFLLAYPK